MKCRHCNTILSKVFIDLVNQPPSNSFLQKKQLNEPEVYYPLKLFVCHECFLVQVEEYKKSNDIFSDDYVYYSSFSSSWVSHARKYVDMIEKRLDLDADSRVMEIASNDGYLLQWFVKKGIPCLGIEPTGGTADAAEKKGVPTLRDFFGSKLAKELTAQDQSADLILGNNVLAHVPDINDFVEGMSIVLKKAGTITMEFPHLMQLVAHNQFDTVYHEHFSYLSLHTVSKIFASKNLTIFDVEELGTHGGSLRIYARHSGDNSRPVSENVTNLLVKEADEGMLTTGYYTNFQHQADRVKAALLEFLIEQKRTGKSVAAYGAAAKGNTLLNYCGIKNDLISFCVDASPHKQGTFMPGSHIPVYHPAELRNQKPEFIVILPWNIKSEIMEQHNYIKDWGGKFVTAIAELTVH